MTTTDKDKGTITFSENDFTISGETLQFGQNEKKVLAFWKNIKAFETSNKLSKDRPK